MTTKKKPVVVLYPPRITVSKNDKYDLWLTITWGSAMRELNLSKEQYGLAGIIHLISQTLLELSETNPYELQ